MVDGTELYRNAVKRIQQLEKLNATLAAEIDRMQPVVTAAINVHGYGMSNRRALELAEAVTAYEVAKERKQ